MRIQLKYKNDHINELLKTSIAVSSLLIIEVWLIAIEPGPKVDNLTTVCVTLAWYELRADENNHRKSLINKYDCPYFSPRFKSWLDKKMESS